LNISIFGLGYVGSVLAGCFARDGHAVVGVDSDAAKVDLINQGRPPIIETGLETLVADAVKAGRLRATTDHQAAVAATELSMICVGTPSQSNGELDLAFVRRVCQNIGQALAAKPGDHLVVVRSTMLPGSVRNTVIPTLEQASGRQEGSGFGVVINPEFLRESTAVHDFDHPPKTVIGANRPADADRVAALYARLTAPLIRTGIETAEMVKYTDNVFHALKVTFANEIGALCKRSGIDAQEVMEIFCADRKLNLSPVYFKPGFAFGGSCLPKDLRALTRLGHNQDVAIPMLDAIAVSNERQIRTAAARVVELGRRRIGVMGFAFKGGTDDLRESPVVALVETLLGKGYELKLYDEYVSLARLVGANRRFIERHIPHLAGLMVESLDALIAHSELILIGNQHPDFFAALPRLGASQHVLDLTPGAKAFQTPAAYERICG
jgi:GDP-mannose 6-dehydrogenase